MPSRHSRAGAERRTAAPAAPVITVAPPLPLRHPAMQVAWLIAAACVLVAVTARIFGFDFWEHLTVGRAIYETRSVPTRQLWSWPTYGAPDVNPSWGFSLLVWPFWAAGGMVGLSVWRAALALISFALSWAAARRMGARGLTPLIAIILCALAYRQRAQIRPEMLASLLMALQIWVLERRRRRPPGDREPLSDALWLVSIAWVWANVHLSYYLGFVWLGIHFVNDILERRSPVRLGVVMLAALAVSFANPFGWRGLWEPFVYILQYRHEVFYQTIAELAPMSWRYNPLTGVTFLIVLWPLLALWRWRRVGPDWVEILACVIFTAQVIHAQRFLSAHAVAAAPYLARDLDLWVSIRPWPAWTRPAWTRTILTGATCVLIALPSLLTSLVPGIEPLWPLYPVRACDFIRDHGISGRAFNPFYLGGYMLWRFWPDRDRLPFMDVHGSGSPHDRDLMVRAAQPRAWSELDGRYHFDYVITRRAEVRSERTASLLDLLDADPEWALVFIDDAAALYLRRGGRFEDVIDRYAYRYQPAGTALLSRLAAVMAADSTARRRVDAELGREIEGSPWHSVALSRRARLALFEGRLDDARTYTEGSLRISPSVTGENARLGVIALAQGRPADALEAFRREQRLAPDTPGLDFHMGQAWRRLGDMPRAHAAFTRAIERDTTNREARDSLEALGAAQR